MSNWLYQYLLSPLVFTMASPFLLAHPKMRQGVLQRCGHFSQEQKAALEKLPPNRVWFHGASMGDLLALKPTILEFNKSHPEVGLVFTAMTNSGMAFASKNFSNLGPVFYIPYDVPRAVNRFLDEVKPSIIVLEYLELWPTLIIQAKQRNIKVVLHNGRISQKTLKYYSYLFKISGNILQKLDLLLMRSAEEADRALSGGAEAGKVQVTGNTKYDNLLPGWQKAMSRELFSVPEGVSLLVYGSIHQPEIAPLLVTYKNLLCDFPNLALAIGPRYLEHVPLIESEAKKLGLPVNLRTNGGQPAAGQVFVVNTMGELMDLYKVASLVFVGGSFCARGGQNILEPAIFGKTVLHGPNMDNFKAEVSLLKDSGVLQQADYSELQTSITDLLQNPSRLKELGAAAREKVSSISGASSANCRAIADLMHNLSAK